MDAEFITTRKPARAISAADIGVCYNLTQNIRHFYEASPEGWDRRVKLGELKHTPGLEYLLVKRNRSLVAFVSFVVNDEYINALGENETCLYIWEIHVDPRFHRQNLGHKLMQALLQIARDEGQPKIMLRCFRNNVAARNFYRKEGFSEMPEFADDFCIMYIRDTRL